MAASKRRLSVTLDEKLFQKVEKFRFTNYYLSPSHKILRKLLGRLSG